MNASSAASEAKGDLAGRRILLTGASGSVGRATAVRLVEAGAHAVLNGRDATKLEQLGSTLPPGSFTVAPFDLADCEALPGWLQKLAEKNGPFAGVVHAAGTQITMALRGMRAEMIDALMHINVTSAIMLGKAFRQRVCHTDNASLVLISSTAAYIGGAGNVPYAASKGAVIAAAKAMAHEFLRDKIRVNCVVSGLIESDMAARAQKVTPPESWEVVLSGYPMGIGKPKNIADAIVFLLSDRSSWITGTELVTDGGLSVV